jgi:hypothetical protein
MSAMSDYLEGVIVDWIASDTQPAVEDTWISLYTDVVNDAGTGTEVTGGAYVRIIVNQDGGTGTYWNDNGSSMDNNGDITFPQASGNWGTLISFAVMDASTSGNQLFHGLLGSDPQAIIGTATDDRINAPGTSRANDEKIVFEVVEGGASIPTGITEGDEYWVINKTADDFQISLTQGGGAVVISADGEATVYLSSQKTVNTNDTFKFASGNLDITLR